MKQIASESEWPTLNGTELYRKQVQNPRLHTDMDVYASNPVSSTPGFVKNLSIKTKAIKQRVSRDDL